MPGLALGRGTQYIPVTRAVDPNYLHLQCRFEPFKAASPSRMYFEDTIMVTMGNKDSLSSNNDSTSFLRSFSLTSVYDSAITRPLQPESFGHFGRVRETNSSPRKIGLPNRKVVFQPSIFWSSGRVFPLLFTTHLVEKAPNNSGL